MAILLALLSAASWGTGDFLGGLSARQRASLEVLFYSQLAGLAFAVVLEIAVRDAWPGLSTMWPALLAGAAGAGALACFYRALAIGTMSIVAPISSTAVIVPVAAGIVGGDRPSATQVAGIVLAVAGIVLASREAEREAVDGSAATGSRLSVGLALAAALGFGIFLALIAKSSDDSVPWSLICARLASVSLIALAWLPRGGRGLPAPRGRLAATLAAVGLFDVGANALYAVATTQGLLSVVSVLGSLYPVTTVVLAGAILHERLARVQQAGVGLAFLGVALIAA